MFNARQQFGHASERLAESYLKRKGYKILERNFRTRQGEIDLIARHGESIVFIEVKARRTGRYGVPQRAVTPAKQRKISMAALAYLKAHYSIDTRARFDVVTIQEFQNQPHIEVIANAFELAYP